MGGRSRRGGSRLMYSKSSYNSRMGSRGYGNTNENENGSPPPSQKKRLDGLFLEGNWYCNCTPRLGASHFQVKKKGRNHGKFFYTCPERKCNFFLWEEDAKNRASGATLTLPPMPEENTSVATPVAPRTTSQMPTPDTASTAKPAARPTYPANHDSPPTPTTTRNEARNQATQRFMNDYFATQSKLTPRDVSNATSDNPRQPAEIEATPSRSKRKRVLFEFDSDEGDDYGLDEMSADEERAMNEAMERSAKKLRAEAPSTPAGRRLEYDMALPTPSTVSRTLFPDAKRWRADEVIDTPGQSLSSSRTVGPSSSPPASTPPRGDELVDPTEEVMALLQGKGLDERTLGAVRGVLGRFAMKARGLARGRDSVRAAAKGKDEKIAGLQERVASLEERNRAQRDVIADFKASLQDLYSKH
ncbi:hypothetical protein CCHL11_01819 [Colletotrichum chlorophyti]|uniref:GRF-type domain-containing protein n=1 Tax=Colletotrichum chlorophyti TaxID=708187 RepID=A0A1Q8RVZ3_9PEZI|nr:hypothetical protein CCHL11_01819 [Colletotrichum chlorophyti]